MKGIEQRNSWEYLKKNIHEIWSDLKNGQEWGEYRMYYWKFFTALSHLRLDSQKICHWANSSREDKRWYIFKFIYSRLHTFKKIRNLRTDTPTKANVHTKPKKETNSDINNKYNESSTIIEFPKGKCGLRSRFLATANRNKLQSIHINTSRCTHNNSIIILRRRAKIAFRKWFYEI